MRMSKDRILLTHVGSLPRGEKLNAMLIAEEAGEVVDRKELSSEIDVRVAHVMAKQRESGVDLLNDGEQGRVGFQTYIPARMSGFGGASQRRLSLEYLEFPLFARMSRRRFERISKVADAPQAIGPVNYRDAGPITVEIERLKRNAEKLGLPLTDCFMTAPSPGIIATTLMNAYYDSHEGYVRALAAEMRKEYREVTQAGVTLQIDAPDLAMERVMFCQDWSEKQFLEMCEQHVAGINIATEGIPPDRIRLHICWGNWEGPHNHDVPMSSVLPVLYQANVGALSIEFANPRHQHEYEALRLNKLRDGMILLPGVVDTTTNFVEHPEVIARRIAEAVAAVGDRERIIASTDCGFGTFAGYEWVAEDVVWEKLKAASAGADIASRRLWGRAAAA
jgi:5-methyltetrahydropteroyltriglutamate--homocysteine methyltransferase